MTCPECESARLSHPRYGAIPGGRRMAVVRICLDCHTVVSTRKAA